MPWRLLQVYVDGELGMMIWRLMFGGMLELWNEIEEERGG